jgi:hypothetical protein
MGRLRRGLAGLAVLTTVLTGAALQAGAATPHRAPQAVTAKAKKKKPVSTCKLLTVAEITQALGTAPTVPPKQDTVGECDYSSPADYNFVNISVSALSTPSLWKQSAAGAGATIAVTGIGDAAFRSPTNGTIMVRKGKKTLRIDQYVQGLTEAQLEQLGKTATSRL